MMKPRKMSDIYLPEGDKQIRRREVESSNVAWVGWVATGEPLMVVEFKSGERYGYLGATRQRAVACAYSSSVGGYINAKVKNFFKAVKIRD